jgi:hypothetical protein
MKSREAAVSSPDPKALMAQVVRGLVEHREEVEVREAKAYQAAIWDVHVHKDDVPQLIGPRGRTRRALRALAAALGKRAGRRIYLEIVG